MTQSMLQKIFGYSILFSMLSYGCASDPKKIVRAGVNQTLMPTEVPVTRADLEARTKEDPQPYAELFIKGPLAKRDVTKAVIRNRQKFKRCYTGLIGESPNEPSRPRPRLPTQQERAGKPPHIKPDGTVYSTNYDTPQYETMPTRAGEVVLNFTVDKDGKAREVRTGLNDFKGTGLHLCLENQIQQLEFPPAQEESQVRFLTLRFSHETSVLKDDKDNG